MEDVVGVLTPVVGGVVRVFHELLVELRLLLVAEVEEGKEEDREEEGSEVESGDHGDGVKCGQDSNLSQCECDEMCKRSETLRAHAQWNCLWMCTL